MSPRRAFSRYEGCVAVTRRSFQSGLGWVHPPRCARAGVLVSFCVCLAFGVVHIDIHSPTVTGPPISAVAIFRIPRENARLGHTAQHVGRHHRRHGRHVPSVRHHHGDGALARNTSRCASGQQQQSREQQQNNTGSDEVQERRLCDESEPCTASSQEEQAPETHHLQQPDRYQVMLRAKCRVGCTRTSYCNH